MEAIDYPDGVIIHGDFLDPAVQEVVQEHRYAIANFDPPYGNILTKNIVGADRAQFWDHFDGTDTAFVEWMLHWTELVEKVLEPGGAFYCWGGVGTPGFRPFYKYIPACEEQTAFKLAAHITWKKKRAYGVPNNFLFTREECGYFVLGDPKKPRVFNKPYLDQLRGYSGFDPEHPALDDRLRRTMVWDDVTEIFRGKVHEAQKPVKLLCISLEVSSNEGEWMLDGFSGSASTAIAALSLKRKFVCVERGDQEFLTMRKRIDNAYETGVYRDTFASSDVEHT